jgi:hypothetical protein
MRNLSAKLKAAIAVLMLAATLFLISSRTTKSKALYINYEKLYNELLEKFNSIHTRDFLRYKCEKTLRVGGEPQFLANAPDLLYRVDGAWHLCMDLNLPPVQNNCNVLSFGINTDPSFDIAMIEQFGCKVHSFDPLIEAPVFQSKRFADPILQNAPVLKVNEKWTFYAIGISHGEQVKSDYKNVQKGGYLRLEDIYKLTCLENQVVDVFKIDIEGGEKQVFDNMDVDYACKYIKQFMFETHKNFQFHELSKFEKCFRLFRRDPRLFMQDVLGSPTGVLSEYQNPNGFLLQIKLFKNELDLAEYLVVNGEFYFLNLNFL